MLKSFGKSVKKLTAQYNIDYTTNFGNINIFSVFIIGLNTLARQLVNINKGCFH